MLSRELRKGTTTTAEFMVQKKPKGEVAYKDKMEKRFDISLKQGYMNKVAEMVNQGMIPVNNGCILHRVIREDQIKRSYERLE